MVDDARDRLAEGVKRLHGASAVWVKEIPMILHADPGTVPWRGSVHVFALEGHPETNPCYAWEEPPKEEGGRPKVYAMLHVPPVESAADAAQASIQARPRGQA